MTRPIDQPTPKPTRKWVAGASSGGGTLVLVWLAGVLGLEMPPEVAGALVLGAAQVAAYFRRNAPALADCLDDRPGDHAAPQ